MGETARTIETAKIGTGSEAPDFDLEVRKPERVRLSDFRGKRNVLLVFHPFAWTAICEEEALDLQANLPSFESADTEVILVSCDAPASRQAWREKLQLGYTLASDFWPHGQAAKAYGVFNEETGGPVRGTFLIDKTGVVVWSLVNDPGTRREELVSGPLAASG
jgi:mycoredoxin-dependent peroxiredoxin